MGPSFSFKLEPNDRTYSFKLTGGGSQFELYDPPPTTVLDFYSSRVLKFRRTTEQRPSPPTGGTGELSIQFQPQFLEGAAPDWTIEVESLRTGEVLQQLPGPTKQRLAPGAYVARLREDGATAVRRLVRVRPNSSQTLDLLHRESSPTQEAILAAVNLNPKLSIAEFSETLGPTAHWDLQLWLAYLGSAHILKKPDMYHKLGRVPLLPLDRVEVGQSAAFVLAVAKGDTPKFGVHQSRDVAWSEMEHVEGIPELYQGVLPLNTGPTLISLTQDAGPPLTFASCGLPNRAALFVFAPDPAGRLGVQQFLLPVAHLQQQLSYRQEWWDQGPTSNLKLVRLISLAQHRFALRKPVMPEEGEIQRTWQDLLNSKWTDPMLGLIALYDIVRRGKQARASAPYPVEVVLGNLNSYFNQLPDVVVLHNVFKLGPPLATDGTPLFLDGVLAARLSEQLPLPASHLDFNSAYTSWRNAVSLAKAESIAAAP